MAKLFGTDGVRGLANRELTPELAYELGRAAGYLLKPGQGRTAVVIGRDSRQSGPMLESALAAGFCSSGVDVYTAGIIPTPAVAFLSRTLDTVAGAVISASHNPAPDNGIKFFNHQGYKLDDELEDRIEEILAERGAKLPRPAGGEIGVITPLQDAADRYVEFLKKTVTRPLKGLRVVTDSANGAAYKLAPRVLSELGIQVISINDLPDGCNINEKCGSTQPEALQQAVVRYGADLGLAFDGDADRVIAADERGLVVNGDKIMVICGLAMQEKRELGGKVVVTVMSNLGLSKAFSRVGVDVVETKVGDRYVLEKMIETGAVLGGEQSGHIIFTKLSTTGDGLLTALQLMQVVRESGKTLGELAEQMVCYPQVLVNVRVHKKEGWQENQIISRAIGEGEKDLEGRGRLLVRASGTEPLIRVMAEGPDEEELKGIAGRIANVIKEQLG